MAGRSVREEEAAETEDSTKEGGSVALLLLFVLMIASWPETDPAEATNQHNKRDRGDGVMGTDFSGMISFL